MLITDVGTGVITESIRDLFDRVRFILQIAGKILDLVRRPDPGCAKAEATWLEKLKRLT